MADIAEDAHRLEWDATVYDLQKPRNGTPSLPDLVFLQGTALPPLEDLRTPPSSEQPFPALQGRPEVRFVFEPESPFESDHIKESDHPFFLKAQSPNVLFLSPDRDLVQRMKDLGLNKAFSFPEIGLRESAPIIEQFYRESLLFQRIEGMFNGDPKHDFHLLSHGAVAETVQFNSDYYVFRLASLAMDMGESSLASEYIHMALEVNPGHLKARRLAREIQPPVF